MTAEGKQEHYRAVVDCWRLLLKYQEPVSAQEYWESLCRDAKAVAERYGNTSFVESLVLTVLEEIDSIWEDGKTCRSSTGSISGC